MFYNYFLFSQLYPACIDRQNQFPADLFTVTLLFFFMIDNTIFVFVTVSFEWRTKVVFVDYAPRSVDSNAR